MTCCSNAAAPGDFCSDSSSQGLLWCPALGSHVLPYWSEAWNVCLLWLCELNITGVCHCFPGAMAALCPFYLFLHMKQSNDDEEQMAFLK